MVHESAEGPLHDPPPREDLEALLCGVASDGLDVDAESGTVVDGLGAVSAVGPGRGVGNAGAGWRSPG